MALLPTTQMACFESATATNASPAGVPSSASQFAVKMNVILSTTDTMSTFYLDAQVTGFPFQVIAGWHLGPNVDDVTINISVPAGVVFIGSWGPLTTPRGTQFEIEAQIDTSAGTATVLENGVALSQTSLTSTPGSAPQFDFIAWNSAEVSGHQCGGDLGLWIGTSTPTGTPAVFLHIPPAGTISDFLSNSTGTTGAFSAPAITQTCNICIGPPLGFLRPLTSIIGKSLPP